MLRTLLSIAAGLVLTLAMFVPAVQADERDQASRLTFNRPVEIPGQVLPAGAYWFVVRDGAANRQEVQIFDADRKHVYATILAVAAERRDMRSNTEMRFVEQPKGQLKLVGWFYPNRLIGHEFAHNWRQTRRYANEDVITVMARPESGGRVIAQR